MERVMVATDGSAGSERALDAAVEWVKKSNSELIIINVEQGYFSQAREDLQPNDSARLEEVLFGVSRGIVARAEAKARRAGVAHVRCHSGLGDIVGVILDLVNREKPDLVIVGKRGHGRLSGLLVGSVSQKLVSLAPCKVLVVP